MVQLNDLGRTVVKGVRDSQTAELGLPADEVCEHSRRWFERAKKSLAGGISSSARAISVGGRPYPLYITRGHGSHIWDADGHEFIDYLLSYGAVILGHANPGLVQAVENQMTLGTMYGTCNTVEVQLAEQICRMVPCAQLVRFSNSGSEAVLGALRAARGFTGKSKILKFEGHYHGWVDALAISNRPNAQQAGPLDSPRSNPHSPGIPAGVVNDVIICPWNNPELLTRILDRYDGQFAAVIAEPIVANNACIMPRPGFLETLRDQCTRRKIVLIFDEIVTGFRVAPGGAQQLFGVTPDMAVFSKAIGGGFPISAFAGKREIMEPVGANRVKHGGTYNGNPISAAAALYTLQQLADPAVQQRIASAGQGVIEAARRAARDCHIPCVVQGLGSMFQIIFNEDGRPPMHYRDLMDADLKRHVALQQSLLTSGIHINASSLACWFVSAAHTPDDTAHTADAIDRAMHAVAD